MDKILIEEIVVLIAAITLLITTMTGNIWRIRRKTREAQLVRIESLLLILALTGCVIWSLLKLNGYGDNNRICFLVTGLQYLCIGAVGVTWPLYVGMHMQVAFSKLHKNLLYLFGIMQLLLLILNIRLPLLFSINESGQTDRYLFFYVELVLLLICLLDGMLVILKSKKSVGNLKTFSLIGIGLPIIIGTIAQVLRLTNNLDCLLLFMAVALSSMFSGIQNDEVVCDSLTGVFNRTYLDFLQRRNFEKRKGKIAALMLDLDGFKQINDQFGHLEGDKALIQTADLLLKTVSPKGIVVRYAGDEFVIMVNSQDEIFIKNMIEQIHKSFSAYNAESGKPYQLTASIGYSILDMKNQTMDDLLNEIDKKMYQDKKRYYAKVGKNK